LALLVKYRLVPLFDVIGNLRRDGGRGRSRSRSRSSGRSGDWGGVGGGLVGLGVVLLLGGGREE